MKKLKIIFISFTLLLFSNINAQQTAEQPNIVFILCDDLGYGEIQALTPSTSKILTPHVDSLVEDGMVFTDAHSGSSVCTPTRYGIMTGRYSWRTTLQSGVVQGFDHDLIAEDRPTIGNFLGDQGYNTALIGKWHLNFLYQDSETGESLSKDDVVDEIAPVGSTIPDGPFNRGFQYYHGFHHAKDMKAVIENNEVIEHDDEINMLPRLKTESIQYIADQANDGNDTPFFLYVPLGSPHTPIVPSVEFQGKSGMGDYADFVMQTDDAVGGILQALEDYNFTDNTLVIFSSDNGTSIKAEPETLKEDYGHIVSGGFRGIKSDLWDGGHRVPFIVKWPGTIEAGSVSNELICLTDIYATFSDITGVNMPSNSGEDSVSFFPALKGEEISGTRVGVIHHAASGHFAYRKGDYKLLLAKGSAGLSSPKENDSSLDGEPNAQLYNMNTDPTESNNLYTSDSPIAIELYEQLNSDIIAGRSTDGENAENDTNDIDLWKSTEDTFLSNAPDQLVITVDEVLDEQQFIFGNGTGHNEVNLIQGSGDTFIENNVAYKNSYIQLLGSDKGISEMETGGISFYLQANPGKEMIIELKFSLRKREGNSLAGTITVGGVSSEFSGNSNNTDSTSFEDLYIAYNRHVTITDTPTLVAVNFTTLDSSDAPSLKGQVRIEHIDVVKFENLSTEDLNKETISINIYPNPVVDNLTINRSFTDDSEIQIISTTGKTIIETTWLNDSLSKEINISNLIPGVYFVKISNKQNIYKTKIIIISK